LNRAQRIVVRWCWELFFSMLLIVPSALRMSIAKSIQDDVSWLMPLMRDMDVA
jgi:hypothetical protein